jgi:hypothetical protein
MRRNVPTTPERKWNGSAGKLREKERMRLFEQTGDNPTALAFTLTALIFGVIGRG